MEDDRDDFRAARNGTDESNNYGKLVYPYTPSTRTIANKCGGAGTGDVGPGTIIYKGALVVPGPT